MGPFSPHTAVGDEALRIREQFGIKRDFILAVGSLQPRKNLVRLLRAYTRLRSSFGESVPQLVPQLVIVGRRLWLYNEIFSEISRQSWMNDVIVTDYVSDETLPALYRAAKVFAYPSLFEGFGLPPLEAMACGTPVVTSSTSSLPEVVGDAGLLVDPYDEEALANAMMTLLCDQELRRRLIAAGVARAREFTWEAAARKTLKLYEDSYEESVGPQTR
jgi:glycosyltransferase involved in cell wall biosynthesis